MLFKLSTPVQNTAPKPVSCAEDPYKHVWFQWSPTGVKNQQLRAALGLISVVPASVCLCSFDQLWICNFSMFAPLFFFQVIQLTMRSKLFTQAITYYHTSDDSASQCSEISFHVCLRTNTLGNHIYITWGFKKKPVTTLLMCLVCAGFCANSESALQGSLCLGLRVTKVYG